MAQVSCEITVAKETRPNDGILLLNVELSPMAAPHFEAGRRTDEAVCDVILMYIFPLIVQLCMYVELIILQLLVALMLM